MQFYNGRELLEVCKEQGITISEAMRRREDGLLQPTGGDMAHNYSVMREAVKSALKGEQKPIGGLIGGEAQKLLAGAPHAVCGSLMARAAAYAMGVIETNASMGLIVAAPTAGSSGVIPGSFLAAQEEFGFSDEQMARALYNAGAVGYLIARNATVSGAEGGCQAEVGAASAMAASALAELMGASPEACLDAAAIAISNLLGLVCDPVAGLVQVPCQSRNALGCANALICAQMAASGIRSHIPFDEMVEAMRDVGRRLPFELRESALGGCAGTPSACRICGGIYEN